jgi:hypothetical protein
MKKRFVGAGAGIAALAVVILWWSVDEAPPARGGARPQVALTMDDLRNVREDMQVTVTDRLSARLPPPAPGSPHATVDDFARALRLPNLVSIAGSEAAAPNTYLTPAEVEKAHRIEAMAGTDRRELEHRLQRRIDKRERKQLRRMQDAGEPIPEELADKLPGTGPRYGGRGREGQARQVARAQAEKTEKTETP